MERSEERRPHSDAIPEISIFQASRDHYGVFYCLDIVEHRPELRIMVPVDKGHVKMEIFLVHLSNRAPFNRWFDELALYEGSAAYEHGREASLQHLLYAIAEMMKQLFWSGDLQYRSFPPEIEVIPLLLHDEMQTKSNL